MTDMDASMLLDWVRKIWPKWTVSDELEAEWIRSLMPFDYDAAKRAVREYLRTSNYSPTLAVILKHARILSPNRAPEPEEGNPDIRFGGRPPPEIEAARAAWQDRDADAYGVLMGDAIRAHCSPEDEPESLRRLAGQVEWLQRPPEPPRSPRHETTTLAVAAFMGGRRKGAERDLKPVCEPG